MAWSRFIRRTVGPRAGREVDAYIEFETADNLARGMPAAEARPARPQKTGEPAH